MRILFCSPTFQTVTHGPAKFAQFISQINHLYPESTVKILTEDYEGIPSDNICKIKVYCPRPFHALIHFFRAFQYHRKALQLREKFPFDILVYNNAIIGIWSALRFKRNIPVVGLLNDDENLRISLIRDSNLPLRKWVIRLIFKFFERFSVQRLAATIVCSNYLKKLVIDIYRVNTKTVFVLYQAVNFANIQFVKNRVFDLTSFVQILFIKNDFKRGGLWVLLASLEKLTQYSFLLMVVGPSKDYREVITGAVAGIPNIEIIFAGPLKPEEVKLKLEQLDVLCIPALREGLGVANIEGLAAGIPVVSTRVGGIVEVLGNGQFGWLAEANNVDSLAMVLQECIESPKLREAKSREGRVFVSEKFDHKTMLEAFLNILSSVSSNQ